MDEAITEIGGLQKEQGGEYNQEFSIEIPTSVVSTPIIKIHSGLKFFSSHPHLSPQNSLPYTLLMFFFPDTKYQNFAIIAMCKLLPGFTLQRSS